MEVLGACFSLELSSLGTAALCCSWSCTAGVWVGLTPPSIC